MIWRAFTTMIEAVLLMENIAGKEVITADGNALGLATDIQLDLKRGQAWILVTQHGTWVKTPGKLISIFNNETILADSCVQELKFA